MQDEIKFNSKLPVILPAEDRKLVYGMTTYEGYYVYPLCEQDIIDYQKIYHTDGKIKKAIDLPLEKAINNIADYSHTNPKIAEFGRNYILSDVKYKSWLFNIVNSARISGVSASMVVPIIEDGMLTIDQIYTINPLWFIPSSGISDKYIKFSSIYTNVKEISRKKLIVYTHDAQYSNPYGTSIIEPIKKMYQKKCIIQLSLESFLRRFGTPGLLLHMPKGSSKELLEQWNDNLADIIAGGSATVGDVDTSSGKVDPAYKLDIIEIAKGAADFLDYIRMQDRDIMTSLGVPSILFNTDESGSYSLGAIHKEMFNLTIQGCQNAIQSIFCNQIMQPLIEANFGVSDHGQLIFQDVEGRALKELSASMGILTSSKWLSPQIESHVVKVNKILGIESDAKEVKELVALNKQAAELEKQQLEQKEKQNITGRENASSARFAHGEQVKGKVGGLNPNGGKNAD